MLQQFIELSLLLTGLYAIITGKLPLGFGNSSQYTLEPRYARLVGILYLVPIPLLVCVGIFMSLMGVPLEKVIFIEPLTVLAIIIITVVIIQKSRKPIEPLDDYIEETS